jgi:hypothetical protein
LSEKRQLTVSHASRSEYVPDRCATGYRRNGDEDLTANLTMKIEYRLS